MPPGPRRLPVVGSGLAILRDPFAFLEDFGSHGPVAYTRVGGFDVYLVRDPELAVQVLCTPETVIGKSAMQDRTRILLGEGLVTSNGAAWKHQRQTLTPGFSADRVRRYAPIVVSSVERHLTRWRHGAEVDIVHEMHDLALDIVVRSLFGADIGDAAGRVAQAFTVCSRRFAAMLTLPIPPWVPTRGNRAFHRAAAELRAIVDDLIAQRTRSGARGDDVLSDLLDARPGGEPFTPKQIRDQVLTLLITGHESTAITMTFALLLLAEHPQQRAAMLDELDTVLGGSPVTTESIDALPRVDAVLQETLRLYPAAPVIVRAAKQDTTIGGWAVPAGAIVVVSPWVAHRDSSLHPDPHTYRPERWLDGTTDGLPRGAFLPFGAGPRRCVGMRLALLEARLLLARIHQEWRLERVGSGPVPMTMSVTIAPKGPVPMTIYSHSPTPDPGDPRWTRRSSPSCED